MEKKIIDKKTKEVYKILRKCKNCDFYIVKDKNNEEIGKFGWELKEYNPIKKILGGFKYGK